MGEILALIVLALAIFAFILVLLAVCKVVYFVKRTKYIYGLRKKLKMQQSAAESVTENPKEGEKV